MSSDDCTISSEPAASPAETSFVEEGLYRFNATATGQSPHRTIVLFARDPARAIRGGLLGYVWAEWLHVTHLWVAEGFRRRGLGSRLLAAAEREASRAKARGAFLSTFDFQAPGFYERHGFEVYATLPDYPPGHVECHMRKIFAP